jgi:rubrerythrin
VCGLEVKENIKYTIPENTDGASLGTSKPPSKCPECGRYEFVELKAEKSEVVFWMFIFTFILDLFSPGGRRLHSVEAYNQGRPGWICNHCGWETRVKPK